MAYSKALAATAPPSEAITRQLNSMHQQIMSSDPCQLRAYCDYMQLLTNSPYGTPLRQSDWHAIAALFQSITVQLFVNNVVTVNTNRRDHSSHPTIRMREGKCAGKSPAQRNSSLPSDSSLHWATFKALEKAGDVSLAHADKAAG